MSKNKDGLENRMDVTLEQMSVSKDMAVENPEQLAERLTGDIERQMPTYGQDLQFSLESIQKSSGLSAEELKTVERDMQIEGRLKTNASKLKKAGRKAIVAIIALMATSGMMDKPKEAQAADSSKDITIEDASSEKATFDSPNVTQAELDAELERINRTVDVPEEVVVAMNQYLDEKEKGRVGENSFVFWTEEHPELKIPAEALSIFLEKVGVGDKKLNDEIINRVLNEQANRKDDNSWEIGAEVKLEDDASGNKIGGTSGNSYGISFRKKF